MASYSSTTEETADPTEPTSPPISKSGGGLSLTSLKNSFDQHVRPLLDTVDLIRSLGLEGKNFQLPKVVATGDQSVGKSSCLEALSGIQLPRGNGIVTRTPLEVRMRTAKKGTNWRCRISYTDNNEQTVNIKINNPADVEKAVREAQSLITGDDSSIVDSLITLDVESPNVPNLTLIDLPGIARYSEDNPEIENEIKKLIEKYIKSENTIILVVFPAGTEIDTVAGFQLAREVDPELKRTMGVITKMDLVGPGSEKFVMDTLKNKKVKVNLGMYAVRCRTQEEVDRGIPLHEACRNEEEFFHQHSHFGELNPAILGIRQVSEKMARELTDRIKNYLPDMKIVVIERLMEIAKQMAELGQGPSSNPELRRREFLGLLTQYTHEVEKAVSGLYRHQSSQFKLLTKWRKETQVFAGKIRDVTKEGVHKSLEQNDNIRETLKEQRGCELPGFVNSFPVCESIIDGLLVEWKRPATEYVATVRHVVETVLQQLASQTFKKFPSLATRVKEIVGERMQIAIQNAEADIKKIFNQEAIVWTQDDTYYFQLDMVKKDRQNTETTTTDEPVWDRHAEEVMDGVSAYMQVASRRIMDSIPQSVHHHVLKLLAEEIEEYVLSIASNTDAIDDLFQESAEVIRQRAELVDLEKRWRKAESQLAAL